MKPTDSLSRAYTALLTDWRFMVSHGWTEASYVKRYGTTDAPKMGDGGSLIWQADIAKHAQLRAEFKRAYERSRKVIPARVTHLYNLLSHRIEARRFAGLVLHAKQIPQPEFCPVRFAA